MSNVFLYDKNIDLLYILIDFLCIPTETHWNLLELTEKSMRTTKNPNPKRYKIRPPADKGNKIQGTGRKISFRSDFRRTTRTH